MAGIQRAPWLSYRGMFTRQTLNDGKISGFCKFLFLASVIKFDNEMSEVKTKIPIAQLLFMQSQNLLSKTRTTLFITR